MKEIKFKRVWAMPSANTFSIPPIQEFVNSYLIQSKLSVDMFARNSDLATYTNDLNQDTTAHHHLDAVEFLRYLKRLGTKADLVLFDPPYSLRQISECYKSIGLPVSQKDTQSACLCQGVRDAILPLCTDRAIVLSFGWNSVGMGIKRGFKIREILLCCHGGGHNDTICIAEERIDSSQQLSLFEGIEYA